MISINLLYAAGISIILTIILGVIIIPLLRILKFGQQVRDDGPKEHLKKSGTPTMGGVVILLCLIMVGLFFARSYSGMIPALIFTLFCGIIGFTDDFIKIGLKRSMGLTAKQKLLLQVLFAVIFVIYLNNYAGIDTKIIMPFMDNFQLDLGALYVPFVVFVIVGTVNSVNLTDGLDGLAAGITSIVALFFAIASIFMKNEALLIFSTILTGSCIGFLFFNIWPARVFMGDTGSLALGGALSAVAIMLKMPLFLIIVGGVFVIEALSDIIQVAYYKSTKKRIFLMAPLHHHFELKGWKETKVVTVFWIASGILNLIGVISLL